MSDIYGPGRMLPRGPGLRKFWRDPDDGDLMDVTDNKRQFKDCEVLVNLQDADFQLVYPLQRKCDKLEERVSELESAIRRFERGERVNFAALIGDDDDEE